MAASVVGRLESPNKNDNPQTKRNRAQVAAVMRLDGTDNPALRDRVLVAVLIEDGTYHVSIREKDMVVTLSKGNLAK